MVAGDRMIGHGSAPLIDLSNGQIAWWPIRADNIECVCGGGGGVTGSVVGLTLNYFARFDMLAVQ